MNEQYRIVQLYGEDLILSIVSLVKTVLTDIVYAVVELGGREGGMLLATPFPTYSIRF